MDAAVRTNVLVRDRLRCRGCAQPAEEVHHIIFRSHGGTDDPDNLISLCRTCHETAHGRHKGSMPAWVLQAMIQENKFRVCCSIWKHFAARQRCQTCDNRSANFVCLLDDREVSASDGCDRWTLRSLSVHR